MPTELKMTSISVHSSVQNCSTSLYSITETAWEYLAFFILPTSFHFPLTGSNSRISSESKEVSYKPPRYLSANKYLLILPTDISYLSSGPYSRYWPHGDDSEEMGALQC